MNDPLTRHGTNVLHLNQVIENLQQQKDNLLQEIDNLKQALEDERNARKHAEMLYEEECYGEDL